MYTAYLCMCVIIVPFFSDCCIDLFSCLAPSVFNKLTGYSLRGIFNVGLFPTFTIFPVVFYHLSSNRKYRQFALLAIIPVWKTLQELSCIRQCRQSRLQIETAILHAVLLSRIAGLFTYMRPNCYRYSIAVCPSICWSVCHCSEPCRNGWTSRDAIWDLGSDGPKKSSVRWGPDPHENGQFWGRRGVPL